MDIYPKIGVGSVRLGMNRAQVRELLGKPSLIESEFDDEQWEYDQGIELSFQKKDLNLLGTITITNTTAQLDSKEIVGIDEKELLNNFPYLSLEDDFEENGKDYTCGEKELSVWVSDGTVDNVTIFPEYDKTGEIPIWPSTNI